MDSIISLALEEVCARAKDGIPLAKLWPRLRGSLSAAGLPPSSAVNRAIWVRLLAQPGIWFEVDGSPIGSQDPSIQSLEEAERIGVKIVAEDQLRDSFLGIYDIKVSASEIPKPQRDALERLAVSRTNGVTQSELGKKLGIKGSHLFYIVRNLECQRLIVRQPTIVRAKEPGTKGDIAPENTSVVSTNLLHLHRYAKNMNLNLQQRFEITKADILDGTGHAGRSSSNAGDGSCDFTRDDVSVKDYIPAMKAICDKLEEACGKVLVVSDIKTSLGYRKTPGHRAWRSILHRLKDTHLVEEFQAEVNDKVVSCVRLLRKFDFSDFQPKKGMQSHDSFDNESLIKIGKRGHITDQLVELPLEHCIYDMIDAEGQKGLTILEMSRRLGFTTKKINKRISSMQERFKMHCQTEMHQKSPIYRFWTFENYPHSSDTLPGKRESLQDKNGILFQKNLTLSSCQFVNLCSTTNPLTVEKEDCGSAGLVLSNAPPGSDQDAQEIKCELEQQNNTNEPPILLSYPKPSKEKVPHTNGHQLKEGQLVSSTSCEAKSTQRHRPLPTVDCSKREERIIKRLEKERFVLAVELHRWLEELEKSKPTKMCKKTLFHTLNKLQKEGLCRCIQVSIPVVTNFNRHRITEVILHPSLQKLTPELLENIYKKQRDLEVRIRVHASTKSRNGQPVHKLTNLVIPQKNVDDRVALVEDMRANGFVSARMIRAKLLHKFLWSYISNSPNWVDAVSCYQGGHDLKSPQSTCHLFALDEAIKRMPLELFSQVVGFPEEVENMVERCRLGLRLSDIPSSEYKRLLDIGATYRLSRIINILVRIKLLQLVRESPAEDDNGLPLAVLTYAMEMKPYIEEPMAQMLVPSHVKVDLRPRIRHDFILLKPEAVDVYWETLEYCYAAANKEAASHAFPGSSAHEVFQIRSWTSVRVMTIEQRMELLQRVNKVDLRTKIPFQDCIRIARELNLTVEQVLRVSYDKRQGRLSKYASILKYKVHGNHIGSGNHESFDRKRKRKRKGSSADEALNNDFELNDPVGSRKQKAKITPGADAQSTESRFCSQPDNKSSLSVCRDLNNDKHAVDAEDGRNHAFITRAFPRQVMRAKRFSWTDSLDRQLVMQYARQRAILGARFYRVAWTSLSDLPALPSTCGRRMTMLNSDSNVRRAVMRLCNLLGARYADYLEKTRMIKEKESLSQNFSLTHEGVSETNFQQCFWDNFDDPEIKVAVDEVIRYKKLAKFHFAKRIEPKHRKEWPDLPPTDDAKSDCQQAPKQQNFISECDGNESQKSIPRCKEPNVLSTGPNRSSSRHSHGNIVKILNSRSIIMKKKVCESLAVANAVELLKLVFLSTSVSPEVRSSLVATLQLYSESDIFAAFNYLKEMNFMVVGHGSQPFVLSKRFWHHASSSPFPVDSGKRADELSSWLGKKENDFMEGGVSLARDLQCGEICHLFALLSTCDFSISPFLPKEGIGEADEVVERDKVNYSNKLKRRTGELELGNFKKFKKPKHAMKTDKDYCSRREKGFPGIKVILNREIISQVVTFCTPREKENLKCSFSEDKNCHGHSCEGNENTLLSNLVCQNFVSGTAMLDKLPWDAVISHAECLSADYLGRNNATKFSPDLFKCVHGAVSEAGEQGLVMKEISEAVGILERKLTEVIVDTLELFQVVIKVNSYDDVRILDSSYKSKYFIQPLAFQRSSQMSSSKHSRVTNYGLSQQNFERKADVSHYSQESSTNVSDGHKVTILNLPNDPIILDIDVQDNRSGDSFPEERTQAADFDHEKDVKESNLATVGESHVWRPILPWINGDGSTNTIVYKGLRRRVLGTVMQNPGILEEDIIWRMDVLNPQNCRRLLELMILDNHLTVRMLPHTPPSASNMLQKLFGSKLSSTKPVLKKHLFANPLSTSLL